MKNSKDKKGMYLIFRSLKSKNFLIFFIGQAISLIGTWIQYTAIGWMVYRLTGSPFLLGAVGFAGKIPTSLFAPFAGVLADRWSRYNILIITQILALLQSLLLALLVVTDNINIFYIMGLTFFYGIIRAFEIPTRHSFIADLTDTREDLVNAIALNSISFNTARLIGPSIGGLIISLHGEGICFFINTVSFFAIIISLFMIKNIPGRILSEDRNIIQGVKEGISYCFRIKPIGAVLLIIALISLMGMPYNELMPIFAKEIYKGGAHTLGFIMSASGLGSLVGAIVLATKKTYKGLEKIIPASVILFGLGLIAFSMSSTLWLSLALIFLAGFGMMLAITTCNTLLQTTVDEDKRGRVMSLYTMSFMSMLPLGSILAGTVATRIGAPNTVIIGGIFCILGAGVFWGRLKDFRD